MHHRLAFELELVALQQGLVGDHGVEQLARARVGVGLDHADADPQRAERGREGPAVAGGHLGAEEDDAAVGRVVAQRVFVFGADARAVRAVPR